jgi:hypothetical protein
VSLKIRRIIKAQFETTLQTDPIPKKFSNPPIMPSERYALLCPTLVEEVPTIGLKKSLP